MIEIPRMQHLVNTEKPGTMAKTLNVNASRGDHCKHACGFGQRGGDYWEINICNSASDHSPGTFPVTYTLVTHHYPPPRHTHLTWT